GNLFGDGQLADRRRSIQQNQFHDALSYRMRLQPNAGGEPRLAAGAQHPGLAASYCPWMGMSSCALCRGALAQRARTAYLSMSESPLGNDSQPTPHHQYNLRDRVSGEDNGGHWNLVFPPSHDNLTVFPSTGVQIQFSLSN